MSTDTTSQGRTARRSPVSKSRVLVPRPVPVRLLKSPTPERESQLLDRIARLEQTLATYQQAGRDLELSQARLRQAIQKQEELQHALLRNRKILARLVHQRKLAVTVENHFLALRIEYARLQTESDELRRDRDQQRLRHDLQTYNLEATLREYEQEIQTQQFKLQDLQSQIIRLECEHLAVSQELQDARTRQEHLVDTQDHLLAELEATRNENLALKERLAP